jgi:molecular chaperone GrpE
VTLGQDDRSTERPPAGPVVGQGSSSSQAAGEEPSPTPPTDEGRVEHDLDALLADIQRERDEYLELAKRTKADFENYRKRMTAETLAAHLRGKAEVAQGLIGVIDNLERALEAAGIDPGAKDGPDESLAQGVLLTYRELKAALESAGVETYDPSGEKFDPVWHEALQTRPSDGADPGTVVEVLQKGFRLDDRVLRAARVVVSE